MKAKGVYIGAIVIEQSYRYALVKRLVKIKGVTETIRIIIERVVGMVLPGTTPTWRRNKFYSDYSEKVHVVNDLNGKQCEHILKESEPDIIALGYTRILRENIINIPRIGIL